jgi:membrane protein involved in colicin uptake
LCEQQKGEIKLESFLGITTKSILVNQGYFRKESKMKKSLTVLLLVCMLLATLAFTGCKKKGPMEKAGKADDKAVQTADTAKKAAVDTKEAAADTKKATDAAAKKAADDAKRAAEDTKRAADDAAKKAADDAKKAADEAAKK